MSIWTQDKEREGEELGWITGGKGSLNKRWEEEEESKNKVEGEKGRSGELQEGSPIVVKFSIILVILQIINNISKHFH